VIIQVKRSKRLEPVGELAAEAERENAVAVGAAQAKLADAERRASELKRYLAEYQEMFQQRASRGMGVSGMRDYQLFIARLSDAARHQEALLVELRAQCEHARAGWLEAAARKSAVGKVIAQARSEDQKLEDRKAQKEFDDRAQRLGGVR
jgi:flagellar protein FliJ